jgi:hypothetical protein
MYHHDEQPDQRAGYCRSSGDPATGDVPPILVASSPHVVIGHKGVQLATGRQTLVSLRICGLLPRHLSCHDSLIRGLHLLLGMLAAAAAATSGLSSTEDRSQLPAMQMRIHAGTSNERWASADTAKLQCTVSISNTATTAMLTAAPDSFNAANEGPQQLRPKFVLTR